MKIQQTDTYPCGESRTYPRYEFWGLGYSPTGGKPGCPAHGRNAKTCTPKPSPGLTMAQLEQARRPISAESDPVPAEVG